MDNHQEVSFKDTVEKIKEITRFLLSKWLIILIIGILGGIIGLLYAWNSKPNYTATLNFVLSSNSASSGSFMGLANQLGINLGNDNNNLFSGDNIIALMKSRRMVQEALFKQPANSGKTLINIFVEDAELDKAWREEDRTKTAYPFPLDAQKMSMVQDSLARSVCQLVQKDMLDVSKPDKNQSIYKVATTSQNQEFAYYLTTSLVDVTSAFYILTKTSTARQNLNMLLHEADSLRAVLGDAITSASSQTDLTYNLNPAYQVQRSGAQQSQIRATALGQAYAEVLKNLEIAKITLQKETPLYQVIDRPTLPLEAEKPGRRNSLIIGGLLGGVIICALLIAIKLFREFFF